MREKIKQLAKENFEYELPTLIVSKDCIELSVEAGKLYKDSFSIRNSENTTIKGFLYCDCPYVKMEHKTFFGEEISVAYSICVKGKKAGETITGDIYMVTSCGEKRVPIRLRMGKSYVEASLGELRDLFQFANLARVSPKEAVKVFASPEFQEVFLQKDTEEFMLYESLIKSTSFSHAMEEFLISIHKKKRLTVRPEKDMVCYERPDETFSDTILLTTDTWGYEEITIQSNAAFLKPAVNTVWTNEFAGGQYELPYVIDPAYLKKGTNYGRLTLITANEVCQVDVTVKASKAREKQASMQRLAIVEGMQNYLNFRLGHLDSESYAEEGRKILEKNGNFFDPFWKELLLAQLTLTDGNEKACRSILDGLAAKEKELKNTASLLYCAYCCLRALLEETEEAGEQALMVAEVCYQQTKKWQILWLLLYLDKKYKEPEQKILAITEQLLAGCRSPILYYELCSLYNQEPERLTELTKENIAALHWGIKMNYISEKLALQYVQLAAKRTAFHNIVYRDMELLYAIYETDEILNGICTMLIRCERAGKEYFPWYRSGVKKQMKLTNLYEYYMYSLNEERMLSLPQSVLLYFLYDNPLNDKKRAVLYAYLLQNRESYGTLFESYEKQIRHFALQQLEKGNNDSNLSILYEELFASGVFWEKLLDKLVKVMFQYEISCMDTRMKGVYILHKELEKEEYVPLEKNKAIISLYTEGARFVFVDEKGLRYATVEEYSVKKLNHLERYMEECYRLGDRSPELLLALCEKIGSCHRQKEDREEIQKQAIALDCISQGYRKILYMQLMEYYYDRMKSEELEELLQDEKFLVPEEAQKRVIELSMIYCLEEKVRETIRENGWDDVPVNRIQKFVTLLLSQRGMEEEDEQLIGLSYHVFKNGKCNKILLIYLLRYYHGTASSMLDLWNSCRNLSDDTSQDVAVSTWLERAEEEILCKILFAQTASAEYYPVFESYLQRESGGEDYKQQEKQQLIRAYLAYSAYQYVLHDEMVNEQLFDRIKERIAMEELEIGKIALLKYYAAKKTLTEQEKEFADFQIAECMGKNMIFPFFADFRDKFVIPQRISDKYYVEYRTNPKKKVYISYTFTGREASKFTLEPMRQVYDGIFVKELVMFYNEKLEYTIYEEEQDRRVLTQSDSITMEEIPESVGENKQYLLNFMLLALEVQDDKALLECMEEYLKCRHGDTLFKPL